MADEPLPDDEKEARYLGEALRVLRKRAGLSQAQAAERFGKGSGEAWRVYEAGTAPTIFKPGVQHQLAFAVGSTMAELLRERDRIAGRAPAEGRVRAISTRSPDSVFLPIRDRAQAGAWLAADDYVQEEPKRYPAVRDPRFPHADQWLTEVVGDSVNKLHIYSGDLAHCVDAIAINYFPKTDDIVEVERLRFDRSERELTIKQVEVTEGGVLLWPRSTNPRWQQPLELRADVGEHEDVEVRIRGLVLAAIRRF